MVRCTMCTAPCALHVRHLLLTLSCNCGAACNSAAVCNSRSRLAIVQSKACEAAGHGAPDTLTRRLQVNYIAFANTIAPPAWDEVTGGATIAAVH